LECILKVPKKENSNPKLRNPQNLSLIPVSLLILPKKHLLKEYSKGDQLIKWEPSILQQFENQWKLGYPTYMPTNSLFNQPFKSSGANIGTFGFFHSEGLKPLSSHNYLIFERGDNVGELIKVRKA